MKAFLTTVAFAALGLLALSVPAPAQGQCGPFDELRKSLQEKFSETVIGGGLVSENSAVAVFSSPDGSTFSILAVGLDGNACILVVGKGLSLTAPMKGDPA